MIIEFSSRKLEKACGDERLAVKKWGKERSYKIFQRLQELGAAQTLADYINFVPGARCHKLEGARKGTYAVSIGQPYRLIFAPSHIEAQTHKDAIYETRIKGIKILEVVDYHHE